MEILAWNSTRKSRVKNTRLLSVIQTAEFAKRVPRDTDGEKIPRYNAHYSLTATQMRQRPFDVGQNGFPIFLLVNIRLGLLASSL